MGKIYPQAKSVIIPKTCLGIVWDSVSQNNGRNYFNNLGD